MTNRTTRIVSAILIGAVTGALLALEATPLQAADNCLSRPKGAAPKGSHWYYRIDHAAKRNCWYVRAESGPTEHAKSSGTAALRQAQAQVPLQSSVANARAEASAADMRESNGGVREPVTPAPTNPQDSSQQAPDNGQAVVPSRWPDQTAPDTVKASAPPNDSGAGLSSPTPSVAAAPPAAPVMRSASRSVPTLFLVIVGALAAAGACGSIIVKFGSAARTDRRNSRRDQRAPWDSIDVGASIRSPPLAAQTPRTGLAREQQEPVIPDEIVQLLAKLSKEAAV